LIFVVLAIRKRHDEKGWVPALVLGVLLVVSLNNLLLT